MSVHEWLEWGALIAWVLTAGGGLVMLAIWLRRGGTRQQGGEGSRIRPPLIFAHFGLAAAGLVLWIVYLATDSSALAWISLVILAVVAVLGFSMFALWYQRRQAGAAAGAAGGATGAPGAPAVPAEQHFPVSIVALHGVLAVATVILVLLTALEVGE